MSDGSRLLADAVAKAVRELGRDRIQKVAECLDDLSLDADLGGARNAIKMELAGVEPRATVRRLIEAWDKSPEMGPSALALSLRAGVNLAETFQDGSTELVWTGPAIGQSQFRDTEQALLELVKLARSQLTLCTFAAYRIASVGKAIADALARGVSVELIGETTEASGGRYDLDPSEVFGAELARRIPIYIWPSAQRPADARGRQGSLHAKFALADSERLFLSSANLTESALRLNMELGVLISGGPLPRRLREHIDRLKGADVLGVRPPGQ